jgi:hypothetical protein
MTAAIFQLVIHVEALNARIAELEAKRGGPPKTPDNSSLPPLNASRCEGRFGHNAGALSSVRIGESDPALLPRM